VKVKAIPEKGTCAQIAVPVPAVWTS